MNISLKRDAHFPNQAPDSKLINHIFTAEEMSIITPRSFKNKTLIMNFFDYAVFFTIK